MELHFESQNRVLILLQDVFDKAMINDEFYKNPFMEIKVVPHGEKLIK